MADAKITELVELTTVADADVVAIVDDTAGTPVTRKITKANLVKDIAVANLADGTDGELITWASDGTADTVAVGTADQVLTSNGVGVAPTFQDATTNSFLNRQAVINGNFDVWQRGTSFTDPTTEDFISDRWQNEYSEFGGTNPTIILSKQLLTAGALHGSANFLRMNVDGAGSSYGAGAYNVTQQKIENGTSKLCGDGKTVTVSFYAKSSITDKKLGIYLVQNYGTGGSPTGNEVLNGDAFTLTSSWVKYTFTFTTNTLSGKTFGTNEDDYLWVRINPQWSTTYAPRVGETLAEDFGGAGDIDIAQVQLCEGSVALPFQPKSFAQELQDCQRYYYKTGGDAIYNAYASGMNTTTTACQCIIPFPVTMRIAPSIETSDTAADYQLLISSGTIACSAIPASSRATTNASTVGTTVASGLTAGECSILRNNNTTDGYLAFSAEL